MDTMKLLLGATVALLLGALAVSWQGMNTGVKNTSPDEIARLQKQVDEIRAEQDKLALERQMQTLRNNPAPAAAPATNAADIEAIKAQMEAIQKLEEEKAKRDAKLADSEELLGDQKKLESTDSELRRARMISEALLVGRIREYVEDAQYGAFVTFEVLSDQVNLKAGDIVAIRRKTGILGQLKVSQLEADGAVANPLPGFGPVKPQVGDELILPPQY